MKITIVTVVYANYNLLWDQLQELSHNWDSSTMNLVVVDNSDQPMEGLPTLLQKRYPNIQSLVISSPENRGVGSGYNKGIAMAINNKADTVVLTNSDVVISSRSVRKLSDELHSITGVGAICPIQWNANRVCAFSGAKFRRPPWRWEWFNDAMPRDSDIASGACLAVKVSVFNKVGAFDENFFHLWEDIEFSLRLTKAGYRIRISTVSVVHSGGGSTPHGLGFVHYYWERNRVILGRMYFNKSPWIVACIYDFNRTMRILMGIILHGRTCGRTATLRGLLAALRGEVGKSSDYLPKGSP